MHTSSIAIAILTKNEARNISECIKHHQQYCDIYIIDSGSTDGTIELAKSLGAKILARSWSGFADQRNYAIEMLRADYDWLVFIDADELFDPRVFEFLNTRDDQLDIDVVYVSQVIYLNRKPLWYAPGYPIYHPRIARTARARFSQNQSGHGETIDLARNLKTHYLDIPYKHYITSHGIDHWLTKHISLARLEANQTKKVDNATTARMRLSLLVPDNFLRPLLRFLYHYVVRGGFLDGKEGLLFSAMYMWFELSKWVMRNDQDFSRE